MKNVFKLQIFSFRVGDKKPCWRLRPWHNVYGGWQCTIGYWLIEVRLGR